MYLFVLGLRALNATTHGSESARERPEPPARRG